MAIMNATSMFVPSSSSSSGGGVDMLWSTFVSTRSDFLLYCYTFPILVIGYTVGCAPYVLLDILRPAWAAKFRLQGSVYNPKPTIWTCYKGVQALMWSVIGPLQVFSYPFFYLANISAKDPLPPLWLALVQIATWFIIEDYGNYFIHRWLHSGWAYRKIHYMHHEYDTPMAPAASWAHPVEILVLGIPTFVGPAVTGCHMITCWAWFTIRQLEAVETHSGYDLPFPLCWTKLIPFYGGAKYHDYHHRIGGECCGNYASVFTWCDWAYGTDKGYRVSESLKKKTS